MKNSSVDLESSQHDGEPRRLSSQAYILQDFPKDAYFCYIKISSNKYRDLHHQCFKLQYAAQLVRYFGIPCFLTVSPALIYCIQIAKLNWACRSFRLSRKAKVQFGAYKHLILRSNASFAQARLDLANG